MTSVCLFAINFSYSHRDQPRACVVTRRVSSPASQRAMRFATPRSPRVPSRWIRVQEFVKKWWAFLVVVAGAISGVTAYVARIDNDRHTRAAEIDAAISALRTESSETGRNRKLDSLEAGTLAEHLEPQLIQGLQSFIQDRAHAAPPCSPRGAKRAAPLSPRTRSALSHAFRLIAEFQGPKRTRHSSPDRVIDAFLRLWHGEREFTLKPIALARADLTGADFGRASLRSASLVGACLAQADLAGAVLDSARLDSAVLDDANFTQASMRSASFVGAQGRNTEFARADLTDANFGGTILTAARFFAARLSCATFGNARLDSAYLSTADARWAFFGGADLAGVTKWREITAFHGAFVRGIRHPPDSLLVLARAQGAAPESTTQAVWFESRVAQLGVGGECARRNSISASAK